MVVRRVNWAILSTQIFLALISGDTSWCHAFSGQKSGRRVLVEPVASSSTPSNEQDPTTRTAASEAKSMTKTPVDNVPVEQKDIGGQSNPFEAIPFPSYRLDLTPESKLPQDPQIIWPWKLRRKNVTYYDESTSSAIMARLWRITSNGVPVVAAFPKTKHKITVRQFVDLLDFLNDHVKDDCCLQASYETFDGIAALRFTSRLPLIQQGEPKQYYESVRIKKRIQAWVKRVLVNLQICPFTKSVTYSGQGVPNVPVAKIWYGTSNAASVTTLLADAWDAMDHMLVAGPNNISSILLAAPNFDDKFRLWSGITFCLLEHSVIAAKATNDIGVVCFHPEYQTPDGSSFPGFGHMHSVGRLQNWAGTDRSTAAAGGAWQRRTPHAVINVLRAEQLAAAEPLRSTPDLYRENILKLTAIADELPLALAREREME